MLAPTDETSTRYRTMNPSREFEQIRPVMGDTATVTQMDADSVILVDRDDRQIGTAMKLTVHRSGELHRAVSAFVFNSEGYLLLQQRASTKYHSGGLWSNTCCGHPRPGEAAIVAASRRLIEEMGLTCELTYVGSVYYKLAVSEQLIEHEIDHVFEI